MATTTSYDYVVIGAGAAGCAAAGRLAEARRGSVAVLEAGPGDSSMFVKVPFLLIFEMGGSHDWHRETVPQKALGGRRLKVPRGKMVGGSASVNSMVWFRGRHADYDGWGVPGWSWEDVRPAFEALEDRIKPERLPSPNPLASALGRMITDNPLNPPTPDRESTGVFHGNHRAGWRWTSADAYLRPNRGRNLTLRVDAQVDRIAWEGRKAREVVLVDGRRVRAEKGVVLCAGSIESPAILMRSGFGPGGHLQEMGIDVVHDLPGIGGNLHDHPAVPMHFAGPGSGYGLTLGQLPAWLLSPLAFLVSGRGRLTSTVVEAGAFLRAMPGDGPPDVQVHMIPAMLGWKGKPLVWGSGYYADVCVMQPKSRGTLRLASKDPNEPPLIDLGLLSDEADREVLAAGFRRLRKLMADAPFGGRRAPEVFPGEAVSSDEQVRQHITDRAGTCYHPVGTLRMGDGDAPVDEKLKLRGSENVWVADASVMPRITSANTNAPSMMIGSKVADLTSEK